MKQNENRNKDRICVYCYPTFKEKLKILLSNGFEIDVDLTVDSDDGILNSYCNTKTFKNDKRLCTDAAKSDVIVETFSQK